MDGLRENVVPHRLPQVHLTAVSMESTAQYWKPVWGALEQYWKPTCQKPEGVGPMSRSLHLGQAESNRARRGRKRDFPDAERLVKRLVAQELTLSFVPDAEQRLWRTVTHRKYQLTCQQAELQNQLEALLEEAHIKLSTFPSAKALSHWVGACPGDEESAGKSKSHRSREVTATCGGF